MLRGVPQCVHKFQDSVQIRSPPPSPPLHPNLLFINRHTIYHYILLYVAAPLGKPQIYVYRSRHKVFKTDFGPHDAHNASFTAHGRNDFLLFDLY